jgi:heme-degrading monooxygenase HmoA
MEAGFVTLWEFVPRAGREAEFEAAYGPSGPWAAFFKTGRGYIRTELLRDPARPRRYVTADYWDSVEAYEAFRTSQRARYREIDEAMEALTEREVHLGAYRRYLPPSGS